MTLRSTVLATTTLLALAIAGCSGSAPPPPQGDATIHIIAASPPPNQTSCNVQAHNAQIGDNAPSSTSPGSRVRNGNHGAYVHCTVKGKSTFSVSGSMRMGSVSFTISGQGIPATGDGKAAISSFDSTTSFTMQSPADTPCTVTPIQIAGGRIWASFACPGFVNPSSPSTTYCQSNGFFVFENCGQ